MARGDRARMRCGSGLRVSLVIVALCRQAVSDIAVAPRPMLQGARDRKRIGAYGARRPAWLRAARPRLLSSRCVSFSAAPVTA